MADRLKTSLILHIIKKLQSEVSMRNVNFTICQKLLKHCKNLFLTAVADGEIQLPQNWSVPHENLGLYMYSNIEDLLYFVDGDRLLLNQLGFVEDYQNQVFVPWFKSVGLQLCPVDTERWVIEKPSKGLNREFPLFYKMVAANKEKSSPVLVTNDGLNSMLLNAQGNLAIGLGANGVLKGQIKHLAKLPNPLIYICDNSKISEHAAEQLVYALGKFSNIQIMFLPNDIREFILNQEIDLSTANDGLEFVAKRIMTKDNGKNEYERNIDIISAANKFNETFKTRFYRFAKLSGCKKLAHFSHSLRLMADLIDAGISTDEARRITSDRFGTTIFIKDNNATKLQ